MKSGKHMILVHSWTWERLEQLLLVLPILRIVVTSVLAKAGARGSCCCCSRNCGSKSPLILWASFSGGNTNPEEIVLELSQNRLLLDYFGIWHMHTLILQPLTYFNKCLCLTADYPIFLSAFVELKSFCVNYPVPTKHYTQL